MWSCCKHQRTRADSNNQPSDKFSSRACHDTNSTGGSVQPVAVTNLLPNVDESYNGA